MASSGSKRMDSGNKKDKQRLEKNTLDLKPTRRYSSRSNTDLFSQVRFTDDRRERILNNVQSHMDEENPTTRARQGSIFFSNLPMECPSFTEVEDLEFSAMLMMLLGLVIFITCLFLIYSMLVYYPPLCIMRLPPRQ